MREKSDGFGNELAAPVTGPVVQAGSIHGNVNFYATTGSVVPRQLPGTMRHFVNRAVEQDMLTTLLAGVRSDGVVLLSTIDGTAGVGKSALAVHWAHRMRDRFPDGELYVNLRGFDPIAEPMTSNEALGFFLAALNIPPERIPSSDDARAAMFRSIVHDKRMLVLLDNARSAEQVRPLLPGTRTCLVVVTSRDRLDDLAIREGATRLTLKVLTEPESHELLAHYLGRDRIAEEPDAVAEIVSHCAGLPLALGVVAVRAAEFADFPLDELAEELRNERERLDALDSGGETGVRAVFSWSYRSLSDEAARLFRLMGLPTGPDIGMDALSALTDRTRRDLRRPLAELLRANLIEQPERGRYRFHDLLRSYAAECATTDDSAETRRAAVCRLLDFYLRTSAAADQRAWFARRFRPVMPESDLAGLAFSEKKGALKWAEGERANAVAAVGQASSLGFHEHAWQIAYSLVLFLKLRGYMDDWNQVVSVGLASARAIDKRSAEGQMLLYLGAVHYGLKNYSETARLQREALIAFEEVGDEHEIGNVLVALSEVYMELGEFAEARSVLLRALGLDQDALGPYGLALVHSGMLKLASKTVDLDAALLHYEAAAVLLRKVDDEFGIGVLMNYLARVYLDTGNASKAAEIHRQAVGLRRRLGHRQGEAASLRGLGIALRQLGDAGAARKAWQQAQVLFADLGLPEADEVRADLDSLTD
ncbi:tetratricopeptide repeat protein [Saccharopolyspora indica]|uniref:ATP-binding protein n=1 Tax=Saccharopolyspora indica TaxID=1229659 RepID=UPI0022EAABBC|nr:tetratricopeptide repeat protein [Saccharopolyspora indica]MDA3644612.1 tetratricopeptide repeat protein [Saccharopolyspora indica]